MNRLEYLTQLRRLLEDGGLGGMIVMPVIRCIWRGCVSLFNKFTNFVHRFVSSKAVA